MKVIGQGVVLLACVFAPSGCKAPTASIPPLPTEKAPAPESAAAAPMAERRPETVRPSLDAFEINGTTVYRLKTGTAFEPEVLPAGFYLEDTGVPSKRSVTGVEVAPLPRQHADAPPLDRGFPVAWDEVFRFDGQHYRYRGCEANLRGAVMMLDTRAFTWLADHERLTLPVSRVEKTATGHVARLDLKDVSYEMGDRVTLMEGKGDGIAQLEWNGHRMLVISASRRAEFPLLVNHCPDARVMEMEWPAAP